MLHSLFAGPSSIRMDSLSKSHIGDLSESMVISDLIRHGFLVSKPFHSHVPYDLIAEDPRTATLYRIQVKTLRKMGDAYQGVIATNSKYTHKSFDEWATNDARRLDYVVFVQQDAAHFYAVPVSEFLKAKSKAISFGAESHRQKIRDTDRFRVWNGWFHHG